MSRFNLKHNDLVILEGHRGSAGTVAGMAFEDGKNIQESVDRANHYGHELFWINKAACFICSDPGSYERENLKYKNAPQISDGDEVLIDGVFCKVTFLGEFSDMGKLTPFN